jgi:serine/threonine-protein kinase HipA
MPRKRKYSPLRVLLNGAAVGILHKESSGAISFQYERSWLDRNDAIPVSLSLPLRDDAFRGAPVQAVFENLLPDSEMLRQLVANRVGAAGTDAYSLLSEIGRDCVGALQFLPDGIESPGATENLQGEVMDEAAIEKLLKTLGKAPLGMDGKSEFRISVAGAQEKTALLKHNGQWIKPRGTTPTTHLLKRQMGTLPNGMNLSNSVENEYYCLKLLEAFSLPVAEVEIEQFGNETVLVVERFDRKWESAEALRRLPQEDCCQALSFPPGMKYQVQGGPGMLEILNLLKAADAPVKDQYKFIKAQILFWLIGATDGHAKNFSIFLGAGGRFEMTPMYDVLSAQPSLDAKEIDRGDLKLAMFVGDNRHYRIDEISGRHFVQTVKRARLAESIALDALKELAAKAEPALAQVEKGLPRQFPGVIHESVSRCLRERAKRI